MPDHPLLQFGTPPDFAAWLALGTGAAIAPVLLISKKWRAGHFHQRPRLFLGSLALLAALLSAGYVLVYLRGGPRIIDATAYFLEARALASGLVRFDLLAPSAAFRGRFLVSPPSEVGAESLGVLFPPGYPAVLALGFLVGRPLWVGPALAALLVLATYGLTLRLSGDRRSALLAAGLSVLSAALRYHTADTMSHGLAALLLTTALWAALGVKDASGAARPRRLSLCGLCVGWLLATRPVTGLVAAAVCAWLAVLAERDRGGKAGGKAAHLLWLGAACVPGLALLGWHQAELTGSALESVQLRYYALADGPPGCFGLGIGKNLGCHYEHGDVVARFGAEGFGLGWALRNTLHRLHHHTLDLANFEPIWLLVPWAVWKQRRHPAVRPLLGLGLGIFAAYGAFYFHGNYPGGGGRFFLELVPVEQALVAWTFAGAAWGRWLVPAALLGFACHGSFSHRHLAEREGGRPLFEPEVVTRALGPNAPGSLVFVDTDHGFLLGLDPRLLHELAARCRPRPDSTHASCLPRGSVLVARWNGDSTDNLLWQRLGHPPAYRYHSPWGPKAKGSAEVESLPWTWLPDEWIASRTLRFEAERQWPALGLSNGWVEPAFASGHASAGRTLLLHRTGPGPATLQGEINAPVPGYYRLSLGVEAPGRFASGLMRLRVTVGGTTRTATVPQAGGATQLDLGVIAVAELTQLWTLEVIGTADADATVSLDYFQLTPIQLTPFPPDTPRSGHVAPSPGAGSPR